MAESTLFKDNLNPTLVEILSDKISAVYPAFDANSFVGHIMPRLEALEFKQRSALIAEGLHTYLPSHYADAVDVLLQILDWPDAEAEQFYRFHLMPVAHFVETYGHDHFEASMRANYEITQRFTAEFSIRPYINLYPAQTWAKLQQWVHDDNEHVRRLVSEGTRPRLPWASKLPQFIEDPEPLFELLEPLKDDPSEYVRRSVSNNLNDITKDHPERVVAVLQHWNRDASTGTRWIIKRALRSLVKAAHPGALALMGYTPPQVTLDQFDLTPTEINMGEAFEFTFALTSTTDEPQALLIDYIVDFVKANGSTSPKVFKLTQRDLHPGETLTISKQHVIKPITTRKYYGGRHRVTLQINGVAMGEAAFELSC